MLKKQPRIRRVRRRQPVRPALGLRLADDVRSLLPQIAELESRTMTAVLDALVREKAKALGIAA